MSLSSLMMSPTLMPTRNSMRLSAGTSALRSAMSRCTSTAQRTASTTLANSTKTPSPVVLTNPAAMLLDLGVEEHPADSLQRGQGAFLIDAHQPRITRDIGGQDGRQPTFDTILAHVLAHTP